ncbi:MAG: hypothetical protein U5N56_00060 [Candidatus Marinimicrobia bacterium]|nr:hypothetical protein [Candidatus Neomarinimicrobiota bacterium]
MNYYGHESPLEVKKVINRVCYVFNNPALGYKMVAESIAAETQMGTYPDDTLMTGMGIAQHEKVCFEDTKKHSMKHRDMIYEKLGVDIRLVEYEHLRYNVFLSVLFCRLAYKRISAAIPDTLEGRAKYWKQNYNTYKGAGTVQHYIESAHKWAKVIGE